MDRSEIERIYKDAFPPEDWANTPQPVQEKCIEMAGMVGTCQELIESYMQRLQLQEEQIQLLKDEIAKLKGHNPRPNIKPSNLEKNTQSEDKEKKDS